MMQQNVNGMPPHQAELTTNGDYYLLTTMTTFTIIEPPNHPDCSPPGPPL